MATDHATRQIRGVAPTDPGTAWEEDDRHPLTAVEAGVEVGSSPGYRAEASDEHPVLQPVRVARSSAGANRRKDCVGHPAMG